VLWTHDNLDWSQTSNDPNLELAIGIRNKKDGNWVVTNKALIVESQKNHPIFHSYYDLRSVDYYNNNFPIADSHRNHGQFDHKKGNILMNFVYDDTNPDAYEAYLYALESPNFKSVFVGAGNSYGFSKPEIRLFVNIVCYLVGFQLIPDTFSLTVPDHAAWSYPPWGNCVSDWHGDDLWLKAESAPDFNGTRCFKTENGDGKRLISRYPIRAKWDNSGYHNAYMVDAKTIAVKHDDGYHNFTRK